MTTTTPTLAPWREAVKLSMPVAMGYVPAGMAFGVLFVAAKLPAWAAVMSSIVLYAGAAQFASIPMMASGLSVVTLASNTLAINLRHMFYAIPLLKQLPINPFKKGYCLFSLTDETFSLLTTIDESHRQRLIFPISLLNQSYWVLGTLLGLVVGAGLNELIPHLDFALVCLFAILAYEQFKVLKRFYPIMIAMVAFMVALRFFGNWLLLSAIAISIVLIIGHFYWGKRKLPNQSKPFHQPKSQGKHRHR